jgi:hypothetical protein
VRTAIAALCMFLATLTVGGLAEEAQAGAVPYISSINWVRSPYINVTYTGGNTQTYLRCFSEDQAGCWWDAGGSGHSFISVRWGGQTCYAYLESWYAPTHNHC